MSGHGHAPDHGENKQVGLGIAVLALFLAVAEILGHKAQVATLQSNIDASNLWSFFQAKTLRKAVVETAADQMQVDLLGATNEAVKKAMQDQIVKFRDTAARMESEPKPTGGEGRKELQARALAAQETSKTYGSKLFRFSLASGSFQIAIVVASAALITGISIMLWGAGGLAVLGLVLLVAGLIA
jgi:Domain of unknown function (DUF4337)